MSKPTPGPWTADDGEGYSGWRIRSQAGTLIAEVVGDSYASDCNASLIAAAPVTANACREALAFLKRHREALYGIGHDIPMAAGATLLERTLRAAIAAAEGGDDE